MFLIPLSFFIRKGDSSSIAEAHSGMQRTRQMCQHTHLRRQMPSRFYVRRLGDTYGWSRNNAGKPQGMFSVSAHSFSFQEPARSNRQTYFASRWLMPFGEPTGFGIGALLLILQLSSHTLLYSFQTPTAATEGHLYPHQWPTRCAKVLVVVSLDPSLF